MTTHNPQEGWRTTDGRWDAQNPSPPADLRRTTGQVHLVIPAPFPVTIMAATINVPALPTAAERERRAAISKDVADLGQSCYVSAESGRKAAPTMEQKYRADMAAWRATRPPRAPKVERVVIYQTPVIPGIPDWALPTD